MTYGPMRVPALSGMATKLLEMKARAKSPRFRRRSEGHDRSRCDIDNVLSHPEEVAPFLSLLMEEPDVIGATVAVGKGLHLAWRQRGR